MDKTLILLVALLFATLELFFMGIFPYPFGLIVLSILVFSRILVLSSRQKNIENKKKS